MKNRRLTKGARDGIENKGSRKGVRNENSAGEQENKR